MATNYNNKIVTDGLVLCLDAADKKSLLAPPTTNLANNSNGTINWTTADLGATVRTQSTVDANSYHYRFVLDKGSDNNAQLRFAFDHTNLTDGETYIISFKYKITSGSGDFRVSDFCDQSVTRTTTDIGDGWYYETAYGTRSSYTETHDFFDTLATENMTVDVKEIQVEHTNASSPLATPFVSYQRQWKDRAGSNNGTFVNMNNHSSYSSNNGGCIVFAGDDDRVECGTVTMADNNFSLEVIFEWDDMDTSNVGFLIAGNIEQLEIHTGGGAGTNSLRFIPYDHPNNSIVDATNIITSGINHVVFTAQNSSYSKAYKNGELFSTAPTTSSLTLNTSQTVKLGSRTNNSYYFDGKIHVARVYNRTLTAAEVAQNFNATKGRFGI